MTDDMDRVQQHVEDCARDALAAHALRQRQPGRTTCANLDCGADIAPVRTALGAQLCMDCQTAEEAQAAHFKTWGRR
ncbi:hypothetical protein [Thermomonas sp.]|uniref:hypothetical protein n=1 Tax=Thermomonas sp. TaxID=1971895 RepID=UPI003D0ED1DB